MTSAATLGGRLQVGVTVSLVIGLGFGVIHCQLLDTVGSPPRGGVGAAISCLCEPVFGALQHQLLSCRAIEIARYSNRSNGPWCHAVPTLRTHTAVVHAYNTRVKYNIPVL